MRQRRHGRVVDDPLLEIVASDEAGQVFAGLLGVTAMDSGEFVVSWNNPVVAENPLRVRRFGSDAA